jgi:hypothetical protein
MGYNIPARYFNNGGVMGVPQEVREVVKNAMTEENLLVWWDSPLPGQTETPAQKWESGKKDEVIGFIQSVLSGDMAWWLKEDVMTQDAQIPEDVLSVPPGPDGNGFVFLERVAQAIVGSDGNIYTRKNGKITRLPEEDVAHWIDGIRTGWVAFRKIGDLFILIILKKSPGTAVAPGFV